MRQKNNIFCPFIAIRSDLKSKIKQHFLWPVVVDMKASNRLAQFVEYRTTVRQVSG